MVFKVMHQSLHWKQDVILFNKFLSPAVTKELAFYEANFWLRRIRWEKLKKVGKSLDQLNETV